VDRRGVDAPVAGESGIPAFGARDCWKNLAVLVFLPFLAPADAVIVMPTAVQSASARRPTSAHRARLGIRDVLGSLIVSCRAVRP
jgi:hypothetical protein